MLRCKNNPQSLPITTRIGHEFTIETP
jgi:hypothetical protein